MNRVNIEIGKFDTFFQVLIPIKTTKNTFRAYVGLV